MHTELRALEVLVRQMHDLLYQISASDYTKKLDLYDGSSIGKHCRHVHDFFYALNAGIKTGTLDYGHRKRESELENNPLWLAEALEAQWSDLYGHPAEKRLLVLSDVTAKPTSTRTKYASTLGRELLFVFHHTIHHMAMIKMGLRHIARSIELSPDFGLAPSTIAFQASSQNYE